MLDIFLRITTFEIPRCNLTGHNSIFFRKLEMSDVFSFSEPRLYEEKILCFSTETPPITDRTLKERDKV